MKTFGPCGEDTAVETVQSQRPMSKILFMIAIDLAYSADACFGKS